MLDTVFNGAFQDFTKIIDDETIDLILTDPPFGQDKKYGRANLLPSTTDKNDKGGSRVIHNDNNLDWLMPFCEESYRTLKKDRYLIAFCQWRTIDMFKLALQGVGFNIVTVGVWDKGNAGLGAGFAEGYENFIVAEKGKATREFFRSNLIREPRVSGRPIHPHQKPVKLMKIFIDLLTERGDIVFDPFLGSGTTVYACKELKRHYLGSELQPNFYDHIIKQIEFMDSQVDLFSESEKPLSPEENRARLEQVAKVIDFYVGYTTREDDDGKIVKLPKRFTTPQQLLTHCLKEKEAGATKILEVEIDNIINQLNKLQKPKEEASYETIDMFGT